MMASFDLCGAVLTDVASAWLPIFVDAVIKSVVVLGLAWAVVRLLRRGSAALRHSVWLLAVACLAALPVLATLLPGWHVLPGWMTLRTDDAGQGISAVDAAAMSPDRTSPVQSQHPLPLLIEADWGVVEGDIEWAAPESAVPQGVLEEPLVWAGPTDKEALMQPSTLQSASAPACEGMQESKAASGAAAVQHAGDLPVPLAGRREIWRWQTCCFAAWLAGTALALLPVGMGILSLQRVERTADRVAQGRLATLVGRLAAEMSVRSPVSLLLSRRRSMPMQWGFFRPKLLLPASATGWPADRLHVVILHELGHVRRRDCLTQLVAQLVCALFWVNPLVWVARRHLQLESEAACDDLTLGAGFRPSVYAEHVLQIASGLRVDAITACGAFAMARPSRLEGRLLAILDPKRDRRGLSRPLTAALAAAMTAMVLPLAMLRAAPEPEAGGPEILKKTGEWKQVEASLPSGDPFGLDDVQPGPSPPAEGGDASATANEAGQDASAPIPEDAVRLGHVDDTAEGKRSIAGSGHAVKFERPEAAKCVAAVQIYGSRYGLPEPPDEDFHVYLLDGRQRVIKDLSYPYGTIQRGQERWYTLPVPDVEVPGQFFVAISFNPHRTKGVYLGLDEDVEQTHSYTGLPERGFERVSETYDWMVRVFLKAGKDGPEAGPAEAAPPPVAKELNVDRMPHGVLRLGYVDDSAEGKRSLGGSGHAIRFEAPAEHGSVVALEIFASRYGYPKPPDEDFHVYLLDQDQKVIKDLAYPYATIERGAMRWYSLEVIPAVKVPRQFSVALSFNPHRTKGVYLGFDEDVKKSHSDTGLPDSRFQPVKDKYDWMVRVLLLPDAGEARSEPRDDPDLRRREKIAEVAKAEVEQAQDANRRVPGAVPPHEIRRLELAYELAVLDLHWAEALAAGDRRAAKEIEVRWAKTAAEVAKAEVELAQDANRRRPGAVPPHEIRRLELAYERAVLEIERAQALAAGDDRAVKQIDVRRAKAVAEAGKADVQEAREANRRSPGTVPSSQLRYFELRYELAQLDVERAEAIAGGDERAVQEIEVRRAKTAAEAQKTLLEEAEETNRRYPGAVPWWNLRRHEMGYEVLQLDVERAQAVMAGDDRAVKEIDVRRAKAFAEVTEAELNEAQQANRQTPGTVPDAELRRLEQAHRQMRSLVEQTASSLERDP